MVNDEGDGRWAFIGVSSAAGLGLYGWMVPSALGATGPQFLGGYMLVSAASFFVPFGLTLNSSVSWGTTNLFYGAAFHGPFHGYLLGTAFNASTTTNPFQTLAVTATLVGLAEIGGSLAWAKYSGMNAGTAHAVIVGADIGAGVGLAIAFIAGSSVSTGQLQLTAATTLVGSLGGAAAGSLLGPMLHLTWGDAEFLWVSTILGAYTTLPFISWVSTSPNPQVAAGVLLAGAAGGAAVGWLALSGIHMDLGQSLLIDLGTLAGGFLGLGTSLLVGGFSDSRIALTATAVAAIGGYAISYLALRGQSVPKAAGAQMQVVFNPMAVVEAIGPRMPSARGLTLQERAPALALTGTF